MLRSFVLVALLLALWPLSVSADDESVQCAIEAYDTKVVMTADAINNQDVINDEAAGCSDMIASGQWFGVDKFGSWKSQGYVNVCTIRLNAVQSLDVWGIYGDPTSAFGAITMCGNAQNDGNRVTYNLG